MLWKLLHQTVYTTHPARHPIIGYLDVLNRTTNQTIIDFYHERYVPNNQVFVVVGDVDAQKVLDCKWPSNTPARRAGRETYVPLEDEPEQLSPREAIHEMEGATYDMAFAWPSVKLSNPDMYTRSTWPRTFSARAKARDLVQRLKYEQAGRAGRGGRKRHAALRQRNVLRHGQQPARNMAKSGRWASTAEVYRLRDELVARKNWPKRKSRRPSEAGLSRQTVKQAADSVGTQFP